ncbi:protein turtle homolog A isoform X2 [Brachyhypopomus gauderio]|uniref:protein turtle homolog A isoform X2 n=1 Tax=Brachyhypopomus gauderio TaxID=698409 RepID=UPI00404275AC
MPGKRFRKADLFFAMAPKGEHLAGFITVAVVCLCDVAGGVGLAVCAKQGSSVLLTCSVGLPPDGPTATLHVVEWVRQGYDTPILIKFGAHAPRIHPHYEGRVSLSGATGLLVEGLTLDDGGWYECHILLLDKPSDDTRNGSLTLLSVTASPVFSETPPLVTEAFLGRPVMLKCIAHGNPPPTIKWFKEGVLMNQTGNVKVLNGSLSFASVSRDAAGHYQCQASNSEGNEICSTQLRVKGPPAIITPPTNMILNVSQNALLRCQAEADPPNMTYVWLREGENIHHIESLQMRVKVMVDGTLLITHLKPGDSGNYTCMPTNGLPAPPTASAILTVQYPAQVTQMPEKTFLPTGMRGVIYCPLVAEPPLLRVAWTKDGKALDLHMYPGWTLTAEGSIVIATTNDDVAGIYTCTPYNSYGTMGQSEPTTVILQDPPSLRVSPHSEYWQEVGKTLLIPCQAYGDPPPTITWAKLGSYSSSYYPVTSNGSLLLRPLGKEHHGEWECHVTNRVATTTATTRVSVLGTSPHVVSSVSVEAGIYHALISWEPGFDGGYTQTFTVWFKCVCADGEHQHWQSILASSSSPSLLVSGLLPSTEYQFSVMAHNKLGSGPFSEIAMARTLDAHLVVSNLEPPTLLSFNQSSEGVYLWWAVPPPQQLPIDGFLLQSRLEEGEWLNLDEDINPNKTNMLIKGLQKSCNYELRLLSRSGENLSTPSRSINISTHGVEEYLTSSHLLEFAPKQLLVGVMGGMGLLCLAFLLALAMACVIIQRRSRQQQKYVKGLPPVVYKDPSMKAGPGPDSPVSILKQNLLPPRSLSSSSSSSEHSSFGRSSCSDYHGQRQPNLPHTLTSHSSLMESQLHRSPLEPPVCSVELIHRGPDGRFVVKPSEEINVTASPTCTIPRQGSLQMSEGDDNSMGQKSESMHYRGEGRRHRPFVLSVDVPTLGTVQAMPQFSLERVPVQFKEEELSNRPLDQLSLISESSRSTLFPPSEVLKSLNCSSMRSVASTLVLQMEHERERGNLSHCLRLAHEREELERELRRFTLNRDWHDSHHKSAGSLTVERNRIVEKNEEIDTAMGDLQDKQLSSRGHCVSSNPSIQGIRGSSCIAWEASPTTAAHGLLPAQVAQGSGAEWPQGSHYRQVSNQRKSRSLERNEHQKSHFKDQKRRRTMTEGAPVCVDNESFYPTAERGHYTVKSSIERSQADWDYVEMCVDEPEVQTQGSCTKSMPDHSHDEDYHRPSLYQIKRESVEERAADSKTAEREYWGDQERLSEASRTLSLAGGHRQALQHQLHMVSQHMKHYKSAPSLNSKLHKELFLTPDAWINSLQNSSSLPQHDSTAQGSLFIPNQETITPLPLEIQQQDLQHQGFSNIPTSYTSDQHYHSEPCSSPNTSKCGTGWPSSHCLSPAAKVSQMSRQEEAEEDGPEVDVELQGYRSTVELEGSCRSYTSQSSGRGSLDQQSSRHSLSFSPVLTCSPSAEESDRDEAGVQEPSRKQCPRRGSVDENYEWDSHSVTMHAKDLKIPISRGREFLSNTRGNSAEDGCMLALNQEKKGRFPWVSLEGSVSLCVASSVLTTGCEDSPLAQEILHNSMSYPDPEHDAVLF